METLLYFVIWAGLIFLMMRFGCGAHVTGKNAAKGVGEQRGSEQGGGALRWIAPPRASDPVCGKTVATATAKPSVFDGDVYYFCSRECREVFEAAPHIYVHAERLGDDRQLEHTHV